MWDDGGLEDRGWASGTEAGWTSAPAGSHYPGPGEGLPLQERVSFSPESWPVQGITAKGVGGPRK